jgi:serine/threonine protein kinase
VALKILKVDAVNPRLLETFGQEIQTLAQVSDHPNIVTLYRPLTSPDGRPVLVLELCRESLAQQVRQRGPLSPRQVTRIGIKIAGALETAHRRGFLHRDLKPQNILVTQFGEPALGDFGVAALHASAQASTEVFGFTTLHAAPEILEGNQLSAATDVYGLSSTMYQLLTGSAPFAAFDSEPPASVILRIIRDPVRPLRAADIPIGLSDVLEAALAKDATERPQSALRFAETLKAVEAASSWTPTVCLAWDQAGPIAPVAVEPAPARPRDAPPEPLYVSPPSVEAPSQVSAGPGVRGRAASSSPWGPAPTPPSTSRSGPSVAAPSGAARNVVGPDQAGRGHDSPRVPSLSSPALLPLRGRSAGATASSVRPRFVDPPEQFESDSPATSYRGAQRESTYEQTIRPDLGVTANPRLDRTSSNGAKPPIASSLLIGGISAGVVVVIAALLLVVGVL